MLLSFEYVFVGFVFLPTVHWKKLEILEFLFLLYRQEIQVKDKLLLLYFVEPLELEEYLVM